MRLGCTAHGEARNKVGWMLQSAFSHHLAFFRSDNPHSLIRGSVSAARRIKLRVCHHRPPICQVEDRATCVGFCGSWMRGSGSGKSILVSGFVCHDLQIVVESLNP